MANYTPSASIRARHPIAFACVAFVVCTGAYSFMGAWLPRGSALPTAVAALLALAFYTVGLPRGSVDEHNMPAQHTKARRDACVISIFVVAAACVASAAFVALGGLTMVGEVEGDVLLQPSIAGEAFGDTWGIGAFIVFCLLTAGFEEVLFRGVLYRHFLVDDAHPASDLAERAYVVQAAVFAVLHIVGFPATSTLSFAAQVLMLVLRVVAAFLFGLLMARLVEASGGIGLPMVVHFLYDLVLFAPLFLQGGFLRTNPLAGGMADLISWAVQVIALAVVVLACRQFDSCYHTPSAS